MLGERIDMERFYYRKVREETELKQLYALNRELAIREGQEKLFKAEYAPYRKAFLGNSPVVQGWLIMAGEETVGFVIVLHRFASYLAMVSAYIEDIYLREAWADSKNYRQMLQDLIGRFRDGGMYRVEIRVLQTGVLDPEILREVGFTPVEKWQVWRLE